MSILSKYNQYIARTSYLYISNLLVHGSAFDNANNWSPIMRTK